MVQTVLYAALESEVGGAMADIEPDLVQYMTERAQRERRIPTLATRSRDCLPSDGIPSGRGIPDAVESQGSLPLHGQDPRLSATARSR